MKLAFTEKKSSTEFHENPSNSLVAVTWHRQIDGRTDRRVQLRGLYIRFSFSLTP